jgi:hypothetical protein
MLRKTILALFAATLVGVLSPTLASARGGFVGGGFHGGVGGGGLRGGGWGWRGAAYGALGVGLGLAAGGYYGHPYDDSYDYPYGYGEYAEYGPWARNGYYGGGCYLVRQRLWTAQGWRRRAVQVCN